VNYRFTLVLLVIAIVAIAGFGIAQKQLPSASAQATPTPAALLDVASTANVLGLDVKTQGKETDVVKDPSNSNQWKLVKPVDFPYVDQSKVDDVVGQLTSLQGTSAVAKASDDLSPYGLANPRVTVTLQENSNKTETLLIGDPTMNSNNYYAMKQGGSDVELVINTLVDSLTNLANNPPRATPTPTSTPTAVATPAPAQTPQPSASS
jgi:hypothetical protein